MIVRSHVSGQNKAGLPWWIQTLKSQSLVAATGRLNNDEFGAYRYAELASVIVVTNFKLGHNKSDSKIYVAYR